jgi:hypothetical protein
MYVCMCVRAGTGFIRPLHCDLQDLLWFNKNTTESIKYAHEPQSLFLCNRVT